MYYIILNVLTDIYVTFAVNLVCHVRPSIHPSVGNHLIFFYVILLSTKTHTYIIIGHVSQNFTESGKEEGGRGRGRGRGKAVISWGTKVRIGQYYTHGYYRQF